MCCSTCSTTPMPSLALTLFMPDARASTHSQTGQRASQRPRLPSQQPRDTRTNDSREILAAIESASPDLGAVQLLDLLRRVGGPQVVLDVVQRRVDHFVAIGQAVDLQQQQEPRFLHVSMYGDGDSEVDHESSRFGARERTREVWRLRNTWWSACRLCSCAGDVVLRPWKYLPHTRHA